MRWSTTRSLRASNNLWVLRCTRPGGTTKHFSSFGKYLTLTQTLSDAIVGCLQFMSEKVCRERPLVNC